MNAPKASSTDLTTAVDHLERAIVADGVKSRAVANASQQLRTALASGARWRQP